MTSKNLHLPSLSNEDFYLQCTKFQKYDARLRVHEWNDQLLFWDKNYVKKTKNKLASLEAMLVRNYDLLTD